MFFLYFVLVVLDLEKNLAFLHHRLFYYLSNISSDMFKISLKSKQGHDRLVSYKKLTCQCSPCTYTKWLYATRERFEQNKLLQHKICLCVSQEFKKSDGWFRKVVSIRGYNLALLPLPKMKERERCWVCNLLSSQAEWHFLFLGGRVKKIKYCKDHQWKKKQENYYHIMKIKIKSLSGCLFENLVLQNKPLTFLGTICLSPPYPCVIADSGQWE